MRISVHDLWAMSVASFHATSRHNETRTTTEQVAHGRYPLAILRFVQASRQEGFLHALAPSVALRAAHVRRNSIANA